MKYKYLLMKLSCLALSVMMTVSIILFLFGVSNVFVFQNKGFIEKSIVSQKEVFVSELGEKFDDMQDSFTVPVDALKLALERDAVDIVAKIAADNFIYSYSTDFADSEELYNCFASAVGQYCRENDVNISEDDIIINSSLAITVLNKEIGGTATSNVSVFTNSKNKIVAVMIGGSVILFVAAYFLLDFINYGRHRKYSYIGMGIITSGYLMLIVPAFLKKKGFVSNFNFCNVNLYNNSISNLYGIIFNIFIIVGIILFIAGAVTLILNYRYFKKKGDKAKAAQESSERMKTEYMIQYNEKKRKQGDTPRSGRMVMKIDFDDEE